MHSSKTTDGRIRSAEPRVAYSTLPAGAAAEGRQSEGNEGSTASHATARGRAVAPLPLQTPTVYQSLVSTLSALGPIASGSSRTVGYWSRQAYEQLASSKRRASDGGPLLSLARNGPDGDAGASASATHAAPAPDIDRPPSAVQDEEDGEQPDDEDALRIDEQLSASIHHRPSSSDDPVRFSSWDALPSKTRVLVQVFESGRLKVWDASTFSELVEVLNIDFKLVAPDGALPLSAKFLPVEIDGHVLVGVLTSDGGISLYSTVSHRVIECLSITGAGGIVSFQVNDRFMVAAAINPLSLHIWNLPTFEPAPFSPLHNVAPNPYDFTPVYCLSASRLLAYASTTAPAYGGSGVIAASGWNDQDGTGRGSNDRTGQTGHTEYSETARRWGEGMMSHVKAVTDYGYSRYLGSQTEGINTAAGSTGLTPPLAYKQASSRTSRSGSSADNCLKSAPQSISPFSSRSPQPASLAASPTSGTMRAPVNSPNIVGGPQPASSVVVLDLVACNRPSSSSRLAPSHRSRPPRNDTRDLQRLVSIAHFTPSKSHPLTLLSMSPNGTLLLTSSSEGHSFHVFELRPPSFAGNSSIRSVSHQRATMSAASAPSSQGSSLQSSNPDLKVWHRYRLNRGLTVARTVAAHWSPDSRFVLVSTSRGTVHVYPVHPLGGKVTPKTHIPGAITNPVTLMPLSVTVSAVVRIKAPRLPAVHDKQEGSIDSRTAEEFRATTSTSSPNMLFVPLDSLPMEGLSRSAKANTSIDSRTVPLVLFYPHLHSVLRTSLHLTASPKTAPTDAPLSTRLSSQAVSGLTQMMRNRGTALPTFESELLLVRHDWQTQWPLALEGGLQEEDVRTDLSKVATPKFKAQGAIARVTSAHEAEIESFSHAPGILPRSIYLAQTITFHTYPPATGSKQVDLASQFSRGDFEIVNQHKIIVREEVSHRFGSRAGVPFDESTELHSAMHTILDASNLSSSSPNIQSGNSPMSNSPAFPNGYGKVSSTSKWLPSPSLASLPIPISISPSTVRQAASKVRKYSSSVRSPRPYAAGAGHTLQSSTLSFEDDDAVLTQVPHDMLEIEEEGIDLGKPHKGPAYSNKYGSRSPAPVPSLSAGTASSIESHTKSTDSPTRPRSHRESGNSPYLQAAIVEEDAVNQVEWDGFKLEGIDDEDGSKVTDVEQLKTKVPSPLLSYAMLPLIAAKSEQITARRASTKEREGSEQGSLLSPPSTFTIQAPASSGSALTLAPQPVKPASGASIVDNSLVSPTVTAYQDTTPSPLSSSPAISSAAEFSASPATAAVLAKQKKKKAKKGKVPYVVTSTSPETT